MGLKWIDIKPEAFALSARQLGKTALVNAMLMGWLDWQDRGSPPDEEVPPLEVAKVKIDDV